jgi:hypothetical protein
LRTLGLTWFPFGCEQPAALLFAFYFYFYFPP